jgi:hypothetical protein
MDLPTDFGKNFRYPLPWIFNPSATMFLVVAFLYKHYVLLCLG